MCKIVFYLKLDTMAFQKQRPDKGTTWRLFIFERMEFDTDLERQI